MFPLQFVELSCWSLTDSRIIFFGVCLSYVSLFVSLHRPHVQRQQLMSLILP